MQTLLFSNAAVQPEKTRRGAPQGTRPVNARFDTATRVARIPTHWDPVILAQRLEELHSTLQDAEAELSVAASRGNGTLSNRYEKLAQFVADIRSVFPAGDTYDPFKEEV